MIYNSTHGTHKSVLVYLKHCYILIVYRNIDQTLVNSLHGLLNCEIGGLDCHVITTEYKHVSIVYTCNTYFVMYWRV